MLIFIKAGAEIQTSMIFEYANAQAVLYSGLTSNFAMKAEMSGSEGSFFLHPRWHEAQGYSFEKDGEIKDFFYQQKEKDLPMKSKKYMPARKTENCKVIYGAIKIV